MKGIKELADQIGAEVWPDTVRCITDLREFATRLIAAYLAEQEPDCWAVLTPNGSKLVSPEEAKGLLKAYPLFTAPPEPAPQTDGSTTVSAPDQERMSRSVCAAPSSEEVREIVKWLNENPFSHRCKQAADLIERLAARVPEGCVVVPREATDEMLLAAESVKQYELSTPRLRWEAMIAAGEVKP